MILFPSTSYSQSANRQKVNLENLFKTPGNDTKPWVFWYWMNAAITKDEIKADLAAMRSARMGGAYLMPIYGAQSPPLINPPAQQLSPQF
ncbi:glycosyl hydrolase [Mucilaginibacter terrae]|uniref:glycosyl hydrolase n=1 Tax=Mucilaginibacter terrae TaxID=1955052 RepID=UPI003637978B